MWSSSCFWNEIKSCCVWFWDNSLFSQTNSFWKIRYQCFNIKFQVFDFLIAEVSQIRASCSMSMYHVCMNQNHEVSMLPVTIFKNFLSIYESRTSKKAGLKTPYDKNLDATAHALMHYKNFKLFLRMVMVKQICCLFSCLNFFFIV